MLARNPLARLGLLLLLAFGLALPANAQGIGDLGNLLKRVNPMERSGNRGHNEQITTHLGDATHGDAALDGFVPGERPLPLASLRQGNGSTFVLQPGYYTQDTQSYCLHAGTHGPGGGEGYLYAPPLGPARELITTIVHNSALHPDIRQQDVQALVWAILARARFRDLNPALQRVASTLLGPEQMAAQLRGAALDAVREQAMQQLMRRASPQLRQVLDAEATLRSMFAGGYASFQELEQVAILAGMAPIGEGSRDIPPGRWSKHPDGYWVRYLPSGYSRTRMEIHVEPGSEAVGRLFDPALHVAVPGNTARQRLLMSARAH